MCDIPRNCKKGAEERWRLLDGMPNHTGLGWAGCHICVSRHLLQSICEMLMCYPGILAMIYLRIHYRVVPSRYERLWTHDLRFSSIRVLISSMSLPNCSGCFIDQHCVVMELVLSAKVPRFIAVTLGAKAFLLDLYGFINGLFATSYCDGNV